MDGGRRIVASLFDCGLTWVDPRVSSPLVDLEVLPGLQPLKNSYAFVSPEQNGVLLGHINGSGENPIMMYSLAEGKLTELGVSGMRPNWVLGSNNRFLTFIRDNGCFLYDRERKHEKLLFNIPNSQMYFMQIGSSGRRIYFSRVIRDAHIWMGQVSPSAPPE